MKFFRVAKNFHENESNFLDNNGVRPSYFVHKSKSWAGINRKDLNICIHNASLAYRLTALFIAAYSRVAIRHLTLAKIRHVGVHYEGAACKEYEVHQFPRRLMLIQRRLKISHFVGDRYFSNLTRIILNYLLPLHSSLKFRNAAKIKVTQMKM